MKAIDRFSAFPNLAPECKKKVSIQRNFSQPSSEGARSGSAKFLLYPVVSDMRTTGDFSIIKAPTAP